MNRAILTLQYSLTVYYSPSYLDDAPSACMSMRPSLPLLCLLFRHERRASFGLAEDRWLFLHHLLLQTTNASILVYALVQIQVHW
jgi:hypothetical protein